MTDGTPSTDLRGATLPGDHWAYATNPGQFAARWNATTEAERQRAVDAIVRQSQEAASCFYANHRRTIETARASERTAWEHAKNSDRAAETLQAEVERLRAAPQLPEVGPVELVEPNTYCSQGENYYLGPNEDPRQIAAIWLAIAQAQAQAQAAEAAAPAPDTSLVTFGARHEGTGMVLLQHADAPSAPRTASCACCSPDNDDEQEDIDALRDELPVYVKNFCTVSDDDLRLMVQNLDRVRADRSTEGGVTA